MTGIERLHEVMTRLRDPQTGCPWDREQTLASLKPCVLEEAYELLAAMDEERPDLAEYLNLFGYNPRYGVSGPKIASVHYLPQGYDNAQPLYMQNITIPL